MIKGQRHDLEIYLKKNNINPNANEGLFVSKVDEFCHPNMAKLHSISKKKYLGLAIFSPQSYMHICIYVPIVYFVGMLSSAQWKFSLALRLDIKSPCHWKSTNKKVYGVVKIYMSLWLLHKSSCVKLITGINLLITLFTAAHCKPIRNYYL